MTSTARENFCASSRQEGHFGGLGEKHPELPREQWKAARVLPTVPGDAQLGGQRARGGLDVPEEEEAALEWEETRGRSPPRQECTSMRWKFSPRRAGEAPRGWWKPCGCPSILAARAGNEKKPVEVAGYFWFLSRPRSAWNIKLPASPASPPPLIFPLSFPPTPHLTPLSNLQKKLFSRASSFPRFLPAVGPRLQLRTSRIRPPQQGARSISSVFLPI